MKRHKIMWYNSWQQAKHAKPGLSPFQQNTLHCVPIVIHLLLSTLFALDLVIVQRNQYRKYGTDNHQMMF